MNQTRRDFLQTSALSALALSFPQILKAQTGAKPRILLRSSWQVVNIGDIAHTPGVLALLEKHLPEAEVILWASGDLTEEVAAMEHRRFPNLKIVKGRIVDGKATSPELAEAIQWTDFLLHGSGPSLVAQKDVGDFVKLTGKPFGVYGITFSNSQPATIDLLNNARFIFFRDTVSLAKAKELGVRCPIMEFGPDGAFACDVKNDAAANQFLSDNGLKPFEFLCCIPRYRYTPYWLIRKNQTKNEERAARNAKMAEHDLKPLRDAISTVVRKTGVKVLICPEDMTQVAIGKEHLYDQLNEDVKKNVVWRDRFWLTDEALSTYTRSLGLFGLEMHSPIMCIGQGVPALVGRFDEQTSKGFMWQDIGLGDWLFDFDKPDEVARLTPTLLRFVEDRPAVLEQVKAAQKIVHDRQQTTMEVLRKELSTT
ncbi:MAG TPA: polysaccharide pyruvyl transferase family protein [Planctomicrobium sp.]|nr:polysaccharide pyruvyl transferase family protein [Planctomicrobium sp.]